jgi:hypothetical protein
MDLLWHTSIFSTIFLVRLFLYTSAPRSTDVPTTFGDLDLISFDLSDIGQDILQ